MKTKDHFDITLRTTRMIQVGLLLLFLAAAPGVAHAIQCNADGVSRIWSNPATWDPRQVPGAGDSVELIDCGVFLDVPATVANLTLGGSGNGGSIANSGGNSLTVTNRLEMSRGSLGGNPNLAVVIPSSATLIFSGPTVYQKHIGNVTIHNAGRIEWSGGPVYFDGTLNNTGLFVILGDAGFGSANRSGVINNSGHIIKEGGSGVTQFGGFTPETNQINTTINNNNGGVLEVASGTVEIGGGNGKGEFKIATGKTLLVGHGGVYTFEEPTIFTGGGTCLIRYGRPRFAGSINIASTLEVAQDSAGFETGNGTTITEATFHGTGLFVWRGAGINGKLTLASDFRTIVDGVAKTVTNLINKGTMSWLGGPIGERGGQYFYNEGTLNVLAAGEFLGYASYFYNRGTVNTFGGGTSTSYAAVFENSGVVNVGGYGAAGMLEILLPGGFTQTATGTLYMEVGGVNGATPQFDQLLGNSKIIDGTLRVEMINDFVPAKDARFTLINSQTGKFSRVLTPGVNRFAVEYPGNSKTDLVSLSDAPIPPKLWGAGRDLAKNESPDRAAENEAVNQSVPQWSYGYRSLAASTALTLFTPDQHINDASGLHGWIAPGQATLGVNTKNTPIVFNSGAGDLKPLYPTQIYMSPGSGNEVLVARWTAPAAGDYRVVAQWVDLDNHGGNGVFAYLLRNGQVEFMQKVESTATSTGKAKLRARTLSLNAGDHLDFAVESNSGDNTFDATAFNAAIRRIPKVNITSPASGLQLSGGAQNVTFSVNVDDILPAAKVTLTVDGAENVISDTSAPFSLTTLLKPGYHRIVAVATDTGGAKVESPEIVVIVAPASAQQAPAARGMKGDSPQAPVATPGKLFFSSGSGSWNDPATWGNQGGVPLRWDYAIIQPGHVVVLEFGIQVRDVTVNGTLGRADAADATPAVDVYGTLHATGQIENLDLYINGPAGKFLILGTSPVLRFVNIINQSRFVITAASFNGEGVTIENRGSIKAGPPRTSQEQLRVSLTGLTHTAGKLIIDPNTVINAPPGTKLGGLVELSPGHVVSDAGAGLISDNGAALIGLDGGTLIGLDGGTLIGLDGGTLIGLDGGTLIGLDGGTLVGPLGAPLIGLDGGTFVSEHGGALQKAQPSAPAPSPGNILLTGGTITGIGEIRGNVINQGAFITPGNSAGGIVVNGSFTQEAGGTLVLEVGGKTANPFTYDIFQVAGTANLGGNLVVKTINGYTPASGDTVSALLYGNHTGNFASISSNAQVSLGANAAQVTTNGPNPQGPRALNISTRLQIQSGDNALFAGFIVTGPAGSTKKVLIRGIGPSLAQFGVPGTIPDPFLELHGSGSPVTNDDWQQAPNANEIPNGLAPSNVKESIIIATLAPGNYSAILKGAHGETGVGLAEVYDLEANSSAQLANIATRGFVQTGDNVLIGGFIIAGNEPAKILVRAIGPSLAAFGLQGVLADTELELHDSNGGAIGNDNWRESDEAAIAGTTIPPSHENEAAVLAVLAPGNYTAVVRGKDDTTGIAVVEAYNLSQ